MLCVVAKEPFCTMQLVALNQLWEFVVEDARGDFYDSDLSTTLGYDNNKVIDSIVQTAKTHLISYLICLPYFVEKQLAQSIHHTAISMIRKEWEPSLRKGTGEGSKRSASLIRDDRLATLGNPPKWNPRRSFANYLDAELSTYKDFVTMLLKGRSAALTQDARLNLDLEYGTLLKEYREAKKAIRQKERRFKGDSTSALERRYPHLNVPLLSLRGNNASYLAKYDLAIKYGKSPEYMTKLIGKAKKCRKESLMA